MRKYIISGLIFVALVAVANSQTIPSSVLSQGATSSSGSGLVLNATVGQAAINIVANNLSVDKQGFWYSAMQIKSGFTDVKEEYIEMGSGVKLRSYPNPFSYNTTFEFNLQKSQEVSLKLYNSIGELVIVLLDGHREAGNIKLNLTKSELENGVYTAVLKANNLSEKIQVAVVK